MGKIERMRSVESMGRTTERTESRSISHKLEAMGCLKTEMQIRSAISAAIASRYDDGARLGLALLQNPEHMVEQINTMLLYSINDCSNMKFLLDIGANPNQEFPHYYGGDMAQKPLHQAIAMHNFEIVKLLVENGADLTNVSSHGDKPIDALSFARLQLCKETCYTDHDPKFYTKESEKIIEILERHYSDNLQNTMRG